MSGYTFGPLHQDLDVHYIEAEKGHDFFLVSRKVTRIYYVLSGVGSFTIDNHKYDVSPGILVEIPPKVEYCYSGKMTLLAFGTPRWSRGNDAFTKWNPDVVSRDYASKDDCGSRLARLVRIRIFGKSPVSAYLRVNQRLWNSLLCFSIELAVVRSYGDFLYRLARIQRAHSQADYSLALKNLPESESDLTTTSPGEPQPQPERQ